MKALKTLLVAASLLFALLGCRDAAQEPPARQPTAKQPPAWHRGTTTRVKLERGELEKLLIPTKDPGLQVTVFTWDDKPVAMLWLDGHFNGGRSANDAPTMKYRGSMSREGLAFKKEMWCFFEMELLDATRASFSAALEWSDSGAFDRPINGPSYDAAKGACFLVSVIRGDLRVRQIKVDMAKLDFTKKGLFSFAAAEPEVKSFFSSVRTE